VPEGDSIFRTARTLHRALAGRPVTRFVSVFPHLTRVDHDAPLRGRTVERVDARGKHLLIWFSGDLVLHTHQRMHGSWHLYRPGERWQRPRHEMRILIETSEVHAVGFSVPVAAFAGASEIERHEVLRGLGPDPLGDAFDAGVAVARLRERPDAGIADALLDQRAIAGIGNVYKSETLFAAGVNPFTKVADLPPADLERIVTLAARLLRANVAEPAGTGAVASWRARTTTGQTAPGARLWVYGRAGRPCRRCGTTIQRRAQGEHARSTYWCERCQPL
jgi:endonuclease-8